MWAVEMLNGSRGAIEIAMLPGNVAEMAVSSMKWGVLFVGVLVIIAPLFGVCIRAPSFWKLLNWGQMRVDVWFRHLGVGLNYCSQNEKGRDSYCNGNLRPFPLYRKANSLIVQAPASQMARSV